MTNPKIGMIQFPSNGNTASGYLALPSGSGPFPGVIVLQEWWGLVPHIQDVVDRMAREDFVALAPDLYHGERAEEPDEARKLAMALDRGRAIAEVSTAAHYLAGRNDIHPKKIAVVGFCMGGGLSLSAAAHNGSFGTVVVFYGRPLEATDTAKIGCPVLGFFGELDQGIPLSLVNDFEKELEANQIPHELHVYAGAEHAFFNDTRAAYHPEAAADAWQRTIKWLQNHLID